MTPEPMPSSTPPTHLMDGDALMPLKETTIDGEGTRRWVLESSQCSELSSFRMARLGLDEACAPYRRVRLQPVGSFLLATIEGEGRLLLDGKWQRVTAGSLFMAPPRVLNAFYALPGKLWRFAWVRYTEPSFVRALVGAVSPVRAADGGAELARALSGLRAEWDGRRDPKILYHWISLIQAFAERAAQPSPADDRLAALWNQVGTRLESPWTLEKLAALIHSSGEVLRRRCQAEMGRSPMQHVTYMRMQRARTLLETTTNTVDSIGQEVGYADGLVFSRAFKRWVGTGPREYRKKR